MHRDDPERIVRAGFHARVYDLVRTVPEGWVTTYGDVAAALGSPRVARHVGWALSAIGGADDNVPWHRVINAKGQISHRGEVDRPSEQQRRLVLEGIAFDENGRVQGFRACRWKFEV